MQELSKFYLVRQKRFYPYEYISIKFKEDLTSKERFYSSLIGKRINGKEYDLVLNFWNKFEMKNMKNYQDLYLKYDVFLLADVSEIFRNKSLKIYGLCSSYYLSALSLSWDAMLKMTKV